MSAHSWMSLDEAYVRILRMLKEREVDLGEDPDSYPYSAPPLAYRAKNRTRKALDAIALKRALDVLDDYWK